MAHTRRLSFRAHCACGDTINVFSPYQDTIDMYRGLWEKSHRMKGCEPVNSVEAARAGALRAQLLMLRDSLRAD